LQKRHVDFFQNLVEIKKSTDSPPGEDGADATGDSPSEGGKEWASLAALAQEKKLVYDGPTDIPNVSCQITDDGIHLLTNQTDEDILLPKRAHLGGFGMGLHENVKDDAVDAIPYEFDSDRVVVQFDNASLSEKAGFDTLTFYQMMKRVECAGCVIKAVGHLKVERAVDACKQGSDRFTIQKVNDNKYKLLEEEPGDEKTKKRKREVKYTAKSCFRLRYRQLLENPKLLVCYRFRWEKIGGNIKPQKPYVLLAEATQLKPGRPTEI
jgi:hypothetical protein